MVCVFLANGFEEIEALVPTDILRRGGINTKLVSILSESMTVKGATGVEVKCDITLDEMNFTEVLGVILPGGMPGAENLYKSKKVCEAVSYCVNYNKIIGAICAAPMILGRMGLLKGKKACCYPGFEKELSDANIVKDKICTDGNIITAKGPGVSFDFGFKLLDIIKGEGVVKDVRSSMQCV